MSTTFAVVGIHGFGGYHLEMLAGLTAEGLAELVAVADPRGSDGVDHLPQRVPCYRDLQTLLQHTVPDVVVLATPIHTHADQAITAMRAGAHVLLEKPTTASLAEFDRVVAVAHQTGRRVQVGFQSFGSQVLPRIATLIDSGELGEVTGIAGLGTLTRDRGYYQRSRWAGHRVLDGVPVVDGVVTNPLSHAVATSLLIDGSTRTQDVASVEVDLYHAHDIEADDTSTVRVRTSRGTTMTFALTLCAPGHSEPEIIIQGSRASARISYTRDRLSVAGPDGERTEQYGRTGLLRNLIDHLADPGIGLLASIEDTGAFMRVLEAVRTAPDPAPVNPAHVQWIGDGDQAHPVIDDIRHWCQAAVTEHKLFGELAPPWAAR
ncbi:MAG: Gfo/Idh/MocA family protein [Beutenbergiaceae bacterium]